MIWGFALFRLSDGPRGHQDRPKSAQETSKIAPGRPKRPARRPQESPKTTQEASKTRKKASKTAKMAPREPKWPQYVSKTAQDAPKTAQDCLKMAQNSPRRPPRGLQNALRRSKGPPRGPIRPKNHHHYHLAWGYNASQVRASMIPRKWATETSGRALWRDLPQAASYILRRYLFEYLFIDCLEVDRAHEVLHQNTV